MVNIEQLAWKCLAAQRINDNTLAAQMYLAWKEAFDLWQEIQESENDAD